MAGSPRHFVEIGRGCGQAGDGHIFLEKIVRLTTEGQVTIPTDIRRLAGLIPGSEVEFRFTAGRVCLEKVEPTQIDQRAQILATLSEIAGCATVNVDLRTDDILQLTRGA